MKKLARLAALSLATTVLLPGLAGAAEKVTLVLNWVPTADHSPYYFAKQQGWYE